MRDFSNIRENAFNDGRSIKTIKDLAIKKHFPYWSAVYRDEDSNTGLLIDAVTGEIDDSVIGEHVLLNGTKVISSWERSDLDVYAYPIDKDFVFQYIETDGGYKYIAPDVTGTITTDFGIESFTLDEVRNQESERLVYPEPFAIKSLELIEETYSSYIGTIAASFNGNIIFLEGNRSYYVCAVPSGDLQKTVNGKTYFPIFSLESLDFPGVFFNIKIESSIPYLLKNIPEGAYKVHTDNLSMFTQVKIFKNNLLVNHALEEVNIFDNGILREKIHYFIENGFLKMGIENRDLESIETNPVFAKRSFWLLDSYDNLITPKSFSFMKNSPYIFVIDDSGEKLYVYDKYLTAPNGIKEDLVDTKMSLYCDSIDYEIDEEIFLIAKRDLSHMNDDIKNFWLEYTGPSTSGYLDGLGNIVATVKAAKRDFRSIEGAYKWKFTLTEPGTHRFTLKGIIDNEVVVFNIKSIIVDYKKPIAEMDIPQELIAIAWDEDGTLKGIGSMNELYKINLIWNNFYIDYESYILYTATPFEEIEISY